VKVAVVIPNWNGVDLIRDCLGALKKQTLRHHVIVVDNGSIDGSNKLIKDEFPDVELLEFPNNAGFAGGVNRGIKPALNQDFDYIALLNNDAVADTKWLELLVMAMEKDDKLGAVAAKILTQDGKMLDSTGDFYSTWGFPFPRGRGELDQGQYDSGSNLEIFAASGGASLFRAKMFRDVGLFDERFFAYYEDTDIGFRMRLAGWCVRYEPSAFVYHYIGATSSKMDEKGGRVQKANHDTPSKFARFHSVKNFSYIYTKNMPGRLYFKYLPLFIASWSMMIVSDTKRGLLGSNIKANYMALRNLPGILADRHGIQKKRRVSAREIDRLLYHQLPPLQRLRFVRLGLAKETR
jgi:GT2 family glycosyltransferase